MRLTGKCKDDFLDWWYDHEVFDEGWDILKVHDSLKWGVLVDFFDSKGIFCESRRYTDINMAWVIKYPNFKGIKDRFDGLTDTRAESYEKAIEKANEIYNEK